MPYSPVSEGKIKMKKIKIAILFGGCSSEYEVSLQSAHAVITNLDSSAYDIVMVGITRDGDWFHFQGNPALILSDQWSGSRYCTPADLSPSRQVHGLVERRGGGTKIIHLDAVFPVLHGKNGEDGSVQGLVQLSGIPLIGCGVLASALCMDKDRAHRLIAAAGFQTPRARVFFRHQSIADILSATGSLSLPLFVKPLKAGSSFGISKVKERSQLPDALSRAFTHDTEVIVEEAVDGVEVGCAILGEHTLLVGEVDEIEVSGGFFNFEEKYTLKSSKIHLPARTDSATAAKIKQTAKAIYQILGCSGFARVDLFLTPTGDLVFNEVNTIPGFTAHSRYPNMMNGAGLPFPALLDRLIRAEVGL